MYLSWNRVKTLFSSPGTIYAAALYFGIEAETGILTVPVLLVAGLYFGVKTLQRYQYVKNIPTNTIRAAPVGNLVEINGTPREDQELVTAPNGEECIFYTYQLQEYRSSKNRGRWYTVAEDNHPRYITLTDNTNTVLLDTADADLKLEEDTKETLEKGNLTQEQRRILDEHGYTDWGEKTKFLGLIPYRKGSKLRFVQYSVTPQEDVYVIGRLDKDTINKEEQYVMRRDTDNDIYIISDQSESQLADKLRWYTAAHFAAATIGLIWGVLEFMVLPSI